MKRLAYFIPFSGCTRRCIYCDQRAITTDAASFEGGTELSPEQVKSDVSKLCEPVELCFFGGSFARLDMPLFLRYVDCLSSAPPDSLLTFSSYPGDFEGACGDERIELLKRHCVGTIELGVPSLDPQVLKTCGRDDSPAAVLDVLLKLKRADFRLGVQIMTGLPGQSRESSISDIKTLAHAKGPDDRWDMRIYPCLVLEGTELERIYMAGGQGGNGTYTPQTVEEAARDAGRLMLTAERFGFNVIRVGLSDSPSLKRATVAGPYHPAFGEIALSEKSILSLLEKNHKGPWRIDRRKLSRFTGHGKRGIKRLSELTGFSTDEIQSMLHISSFAT